MADRDFPSLSAELGAALLVRGWTLALAESCTGGWTSEVVTMTPGSSAWFDRGFVTYSNAAKVETLGVATETLEQFGAVSEETAREMAYGTLSHSHAQVSAAITGIAGPDGGTPEKPVGLVWFAWAGPNSKVRTENRIFQGTREEVRRQSVEHALRRLLGILPHWDDSA